MTFYPFNLYLHPKYLFSSNGFYRQVSGLAGYAVRQIDLFTNALTDRNVPNAVNRSHQYSLDRLEYLGDAIISTVVAEFLFNTFSNKSEGFLSQKRDLIVNGKSLSMFAHEMGLIELVQPNSMQKKVVNRNRQKLLADMLEAFIGAIYLDSSYEYARLFIYRHILNHLDVATLVSQNTNYKSQLLELIQSEENRILEYRVLDERGPAHAKEFKIGVYINNEPYETGTGRSKKEAEQHAAAKTLERLNAKEN